MFRFLRRWLRHSPHIHVHQGRVSNLTLLVELFDRFLDGPMAYELEWDDFISWEQFNPNVEEVRLRLGEVEHLLFSKKGSEKAKYGSIVAKERDRAAALCGIAAREQKTHS